MVIITFGIHVGSFYLRNIPCVTHHRNHVPLLLGLAHLDDFWLHYLFDRVSVLGSIPLIPYYGHSVNWSLISILFLSLNDFDRSVC